MSLADVNVLAVLVAGYQLTSVAIMAVVLGAWR